MAIAFFISSAGDTNLAKETIDTLLQQKFPQPIYVISLTDVAEKCSAAIAKNNLVQSLTLNNLLKKSGVSSEEKLSEEELNEINKFIAANKIHRAYVGVPSPVDEQRAFQITEHLTIPATIAYEYMFTAPPQHALWEYVGRLSTHLNIDFAVPFSAAKEDILQINPYALVYTIGHLSVERALANKPVYSATLREKLDVAHGSVLVFASGSSQPHDTDLNFLTALLSALAHENHPELSIKFGIHPGVKDIANYIKKLTQLCAQFPTLQQQFKIIIPDCLREKIIEPSDFFQYANVNGAELANNADKVAQAVPGASVIEADLDGRSAYCHQNVKIYLPQNHITNNLVTFFASPKRAASTREDLAITDTPQSIMASLMSR